MPISIVEYVGPSDKNSCGYCKNKAFLERRGGAESEESDDDKGDSCSFGVWAHSLSTAHYNHMLDAGWRRSGCYMYKPTMAKTCCPQYTIRLDSRAFVMSRTQKRVLKQMHEYLKDGKRPRCGVKESAEAMEKDEVPAREEQEQEERKKKQPAKKPCKEQGPLRKKKVMRRERAIARWTAKGLDVEEEQRRRAEKEQARRRTLEQLMADGGGEWWKHKLEVKLVLTDSVEFAASATESYELYKKYQMTIHKDSHNERSGYERFLVRSPLFHVDDGIDPKLGSYHQQYWLDGKLIAVGVVDVLPRCVSAKYMYYDPAYSFLSLGTYTALRELMFTRELNVNRPELHYYYMGYYIESCPKMRYKGKFRPSELLCDQSFEWVAVDECRRMLAINDNRFTVFRPRARRAPRMNPQDLLLFRNSRVIPYPILTLTVPSYVETPEIAEKLRLYSDAVTPSAKRLVLYLNEIASLAEEGEEEEEEEEEDDE